MSLKKNHLKKITIDILFIILQWHLLFSLGLYALPKTP